MLAELTLFINKMRNLTQDTSSNEVPLFEVSFPLWLKKMAKTYFHRDFLYLTDFVVLWK